MLQSGQRNRGGAGVHIYGRTYAWPEARHQASIQPLIRVPMRSPRLWWRPPVSALPSHIAVASITVAPCPVCPCVLPSSSFLSSGCSGWGDGSAHRWLVLSSAAGQVPVSWWGGWCRGCLLPWGEVRSSCLVSDSPVVSEAIDEVEGPLLLTGCPRFACGARFITGRGLCRSRGRPSCR